MMKKVTDTNPNLIISLIENKLFKKNIMEALALIGVFREKFPFNKKIDYFLENILMKPYDLLSYLPKHQILNN